MTTLYATDRNAVQKALKEAINYSVHTGGELVVLLAKGGDQYQAAWKALAEWCDCRGDESGDWEFVGVDAFHQFANIRLLEVA